MYATLVNEVLKVSFRLGRETGGESMHSVVLSRWLIPSGMARLPPSPFPILKPGDAVYCIAACLR